MVREARGGMRPTHNGVSQPVLESGPDVDTDPGLSRPKVRGARGAECTTPRHPPTVRLGLRRCALGTTSANVSRPGVHHKAIPCAARCQSATGKLLMHLRAETTPRRFSPDYSW